MSQFVELSLEGIEEGTFLAEANEELLKVQRALLAHVEKYGDDATAGTSAELTMSVKLTSAKDTPGAFQIKTAVKYKVPGRPNGVTLAMAAPSQTGDGTVLHMRASGTSKDSPKQGVLATRDGRTVDTTTGEVIPDGGDEPDAEPGD